MLTADEDVKSIEAVHAVHGIIIGETTLSIFIPDTGGPVAHELEL